MIPSSREIAQQLLVLAELHPELTVSELALELALSPIFIVDALEYAKANGWVRHDQAEDTIEVVHPFEFDRNNIDVFGGEIARLIDSIVSVIQGLNDRNEPEDIEEDKLKVWCRGIRPSALEIALFALTRNGDLAKYDLKDPKDEESVYTFYTLPENKDNFWGLKQFHHEK